MKNGGYTIMKDISALFEIFPICQRILMNTVVLHDTQFTKTQLFILYTLSAKGSVNMSEIASYIASSKEQATRAVAPLVKQGYVARFHNESNRKKVYIRLTDQGYDVIKQEKGLIKDFLANKLNSLSEEDLEILRESLSNLLKVLRKLE
ncbi:MarR family winged helix-turn-helix transcriptional regulator [Anaerostipes faecalis]|uniref:MarR family winged helix-turn-helix transcriptional regulator n=2 Tax=Lachnospiraceae TaxID=186803 RepID=UPI001E63AC3A|nr:MarR family transcriptional regulator [Anaerostipes faecalis]